MNIAIIGGGISGLSNAYHIFKRFPKAKVTLFEQSDRIGGCIKSYENCEAGPRSIRVSKYSPLILSMIDDIGLGPECIKYFQQVIPSVPQPYAYIYHEDKLRALPDQISIQTLLRFVKDNGSDIPGLIKGWMNYRKSEEDVSLFNLLRKSLSERLVRKYVETVFYGIYGTSIENLSADICFQKKHLREFNTQMKVHYSKEFEKQLAFEKIKSFRFIYGLESLPKSINKYVSDFNYQLLLNTQIEKIDFQNKIIHSSIGDHQYDHVLLNVPKQSLSKIFDGQVIIEPLINSIQTTGMYCKNYHFEKKVLPEDFKGFGYLVNPDQKQSILGVVMDSISFPTLSKATSLSIMTRQFTSNEVILKELSKHLNVQLPNPDQILEDNWENAFTIYGVNHLQKSQQLINAIDTLSNGSAHLSGTIVSTQAIPELVYQSYSIINKL